MQPVWLLSLSARGDESHLEFFVESLGPDEARETNSACGSDGNGALNKLTTRDVRHELSSFTFSE